LNSKKSNPEKSGSGIYTLFGHTTIGRIQTRDDSKGLATEAFALALIDPADTRIKIVEGFRVLRTKHGEPLQRKHGNIPL